VVVYDHRVKRPFAPTGPNPGDGRADASYEALSHRLFARGARA
jgi:hypothetical protein